MSMCEASAAPRSAGVNCISGVPGFSSPPDMPRKSAAWAFARTITSLASTTTTPSCEYSSASASRACALRRCSTSRSIIILMLPRITPIAASNAPSSSALPRGCARSWAGSGAGSCVMRPRLSARVDESLTSCEQGGVCGYGAFTLRLTARAHLSLSLWAFTQKHTTPARRQARNGSLKSYFQRSSSRNHGLPRAGSVPAPCCALRKHHRPGAQRERRDRSIPGSCPSNSRARH